MHTQINIYIHIQIKSHCTHFNTVIRKLHLKIAAFWWGGGNWDLISPDQGSNPSPLHWKCGILTTG